MVSELYLTYAHAHPIENTHSIMRIHLIYLVLTMNTLMTACGTATHLDTLHHQEALPVEREPYTGMNDLLFPAIPIKSTHYFESYRFQPLVYIDEKSEKPETFTYIFVTPNLPTKYKDFSKTVKHWYTQQQELHDVKFKLIKKSDAKVAGSPAKYLLIESNGYGEKLRKKRTYHHHVYLFPVGTSSITEIRLSRLKENDKTDSKLWQQWPVFIKSIKNAEPDSVGLTTIGQNDNTRRYYAHDLSFDLPLGDSREVGKWIIQNAADRKDTWITQKGNITLNISLIDDYDFTVAKKSERYKQESEAFETGGAAYFEKLAGEKNLEYEQIEIPFGKNNMFYGYIEKTETHSEVTLKSAYKVGRAIKIKFEAKNEVFDEYKDEIIAWVKNIIILP